MAMTSRERFQAVFRGELPDRVPVTLFIQDQGHFINQMYPDIDPWDYRAIQLKVIEISRQLGADVFVRLLFGTLDLAGPDVTERLELASLIGLGVVLLVVTVVLSAIVRLVARRFATVYAY